MPPTPDSANPESTVPDLLRAAERALTGPGVVLTTSGSTGQPKSVALSAGALRASAEATEQRIGGPGQWLLALPTDHVAGWQVIVRSALAGSTPARVAGPFTPASFATAAAALTGERRYVSLVPTQVLRLAQDPAALAQLATFDAVLVGGAALPAPVRQQCLDAGVAIQRTYGMTETSGGCLYDGTPLSGVGVQIAEGRVLLSGPVLATEYVGDPTLTAERFVTGADGQRWFRTDDLGELDEQGRLHLAGRADDVINSGGLKIAPHPVQEALLRLPEVAEALVLGVPDVQWGQRVAAVLVAHHEPTGAGRFLPDTAAVRDLLRDHLPATSLPRQVLWVQELPLLASGKPDRVALRDRCAGESEMMGSPRSPAG